MESNIPMAPGGCVYKQKTLTWEAISATQSAYESSKYTSIITTGNFISYIIHII